MTHLSAFRVNRGSRSRKELRPATKQPSGTQGSKTRGVEAEVAIRMMSDSKTASWGETAAVTVTGTRSAISSLNAVILSALRS